MQEAWSKGVTGRVRIACVPATRADVNRYIQAYSELLAELR